jgi:quinol monooxygenase YgiN
LSAAKSGDSATRDGRFPDFTSFNPGYELKSGRPHPAPPEILRPFFIFVRFHVHEGREAEAAAAMRAVVPPSRAEPGCLSIDAFAATRNPRLFYIHSRWVDEAAFDLHATLPHTVRFVETMTPLIDHPFEATRARVME